MTSLLTTLGPLFLTLTSQPAPEAVPTPDTGPLAAVQEDEKKEERSDLKHLNLGKEGLALDGYDPVAYFAEGGGKAKEGSKKITLRHGGVLYRFASEKNRELFEKTPSKFEPKYGGWCAYAMALDEKVEVDPKSFLVTNGELKLFYKGFLNDTRKKWQKEPKVLEPKADANWKKLTEKK